MDDRNQKDAVILGAGPCGLACAYELIKSGKNIKPIIIDKNSSAGGLSRTVYFDGSGIDIGGHRLYTKIDYIEKIWKEFLPVQTKPSKDDIIANRMTSYPKGETEVDPEKSDDVMLIQRRFSNIIYKGRFFDYPVKFNIKTVCSLGFFTSFFAGLSCIKSMIFKRKENSLEDFMINRFGKGLYDIFFKDYTKKVWGRGADGISAEWGNERIRGLSLFKTLINALAGNFLKKNNAKETSLIDEFYYPKYGCSQLWDKMAKYVTENGGEIYFDSTFDSFIINDGKIKGVKFVQNGEIKELSTDYVVSSIPITDIMRYADAPHTLKNDAMNLPYRDYMIVGLYTDKFNLKNNTDYKMPNDITPCNWIYVQERYAVTARMQIMNNWSCYLVKDYPDKYMISLEYYANVGDELWQKSDDELVKLAISECEKYNFFNSENVLNSKVIREEKAYPAYWGTYSKIDKIKEYLTSYTNLYLAGRNGQHRYTNMDESMMFGIEAARKIAEKY